MKPLRKVLTLYFVTVLLTCGGITGTLLLGSRLPTTPTHEAVAERSVERRDFATYALVDLAKSLKLHFNSSLSHLLLQFVVVIAFARLAGGLCVRVGQPAVIGEIVAGILLGPSMLDPLMPTASAFLFPEHSMDALRLLSQIGVCFFMFVVGMELDTRKLTGNSHVSLVVSHVSIAVPYFLGVLLAYFLFGELSGPNSSFISFALFMGICMSITAFPVLARILKDRGLIQTTIGSTSLICAAIDDATAWTILAFVVAVAGGSNLISVILNTLLVLLFVAIMVLAVRRALPHLLGSQQITAEEPSHGTVAIVVCLVTAASLTTETMGIHAVFGAFMMGTMMPLCHGFRTKLIARIDPLSSAALLPLFFVFTGLRTQIGLLHDLESWSLCALITLVATVGKLGGGAIAARSAGMSWNESLQLGTLMNTRGLMELIALNIGYDLGILPPRIFTILVIMAILTTMMTGPLLTLLLKYENEGLKARRAFLRPT